MEAGTIAVSGSTGLVGSALLKDLGGRRVMRLVRVRAGDAGSVPWDPASGVIDAERLSACDAVVHLAGEPIAARRWSGTVKEKILRSRVDGTRLIAGALSGLPKRPRVLVSASAIGFYGDRGDETLDENSLPGDDFLSRVARGWEAEAQRASAAGVRVVCLRFGIILAKEGGALRKMLTPFKLGAGGPLGSGRQWMSWIHLRDVVGAIRLALDRHDLAGPVNVVAPGAVRNADFTRALGRALRRPTLLPAPAFALKMAMGEMAEALLLSSQRVVPARLRQAGFAFRYPELDGALKDLVG